MSGDRIRTNEYGGKGVLHTLPDGAYVRLEQNDGWRAAEWPTRLGAVAALAVVMNRYTVESLIAGASCVVIDDAEMAHDMRMVDKATGFWRVDTADDSAFTWDGAGDETKDPRFAAVVSDEKLADIIRATAVESVVTHMNEIDLRVK